MQYVLLILAALSFNVSAQMKCENSDGFEVCRNLAPLSLNYNRPIMLIGRLHKGIGADGKPYVFIKMDKAINTYVPRGEETPVLKNEKKVTRLRLQTMSVDAEFIAGVWKRYANLFEKPVQVNCLYLTSDLSGAGTRVICALIGIRPAN